MKIFRDVSLKDYNTFGLDYTARKLIHIEDTSEVSFALDQVIENEPMLVIGGGSNLLFTSDFPGTILHPEIKGIKIEERNGGHVIVSVGAGENWDSFVKWSVESSLYGLENLSLIPGDVGASAVQNIGAYGSEVKDLIERIETISLEDSSGRIFSAEECEFAYRHSVFKGRQKNKYLVTRVFYRLSTLPSFRLAYGTLEDELRGHEITLESVRDAVINIRKRKLPDPMLTGNAGSFFKNPILSRDIADNLKNIYPGLPLYPDENGSFKTAAGWLIEQCGWKGRSFGNAAVHDKQALVLINRGNASGQEILKLSELIMENVNAKFGIMLEREVEVI